MVAPGAVVGAVAIGSPEVASASKIAGRWIVSILAPSACLTVVPRLSAAIAAWLAWPTVKVDGLSASARK